MKPLKSFLIALTSTLFSFLALANIANAQFSDVQDDSLTYMHRHGMVDGYPDGTFGSKKEINRAELLKLIMEASHIEVDEDIANCFPDTEASAWYIPYVCKAKQENWVQGYPDGTFKPEQFVNKVEALKMIAEIQGDWRFDQAWFHELPFNDIEKESWYYKYIETADYFIYIDEADYYYPANFMTREEVADLLFRTIIEERMGAASLSKVDFEAKKNDFFRIEEEALKQTYDNFEAYKDEIESIYEDCSSCQFEPSLRVSDEETGHIYALMRLNVQGPKEGGWLESVSAPSKNVIWLIAQFDESNDLLNFNWYNEYVGSTTGINYKLINVVDNLVNIEAWGTQASGYVSKLRESTIVLDELR